MQDIMIVSLRLVLTTAITATPQFNRCLRILKYRMLSQLTGSDKMDKVTEIFTTAIESVKPLQMVQNSLRFCPQTKTLQYSHGDQNKSLALTHKKCHVVAYGKAVIGMVTAVESVLGDRIESGIASIPTNILQELKKHGRSDLIPGSSSRVRLCEGAHLNIPDEACMDTSRKIMELANSLQNDDLLITLTSGGGSALLSLPVPPITLQDLVTTTKSLAKAGADIVELNTVRKHLEILKGGGLARIAYPAQVVNLILSDIVGDPLDCIASGPTVRDTSSPRDALDIVNKYLTPKQVQPAVIEVLSTDAKSRYLDSLNSFREFPHDFVHNLIIGSNTVALDSAAQKCHCMDIKPVVMTSRLCGKASQVGRDMAELAWKMIKSDDQLLEGLFQDTHNYPDGLQDSLRQAITEAKQSSQPLCLLFGGETTVEVKGSGKGGRNQEMCLSAMLELSSHQAPAFQVTFASVGTDGQDGPTDAAGAIVTAGSLAGNSSDNCPYKALENNDSYTFFTKLNSGKNLVTTGLTGTNVMDISVLLISHI